MKNPSSKIQNSAAPGGTDQPSDAQLQPATAAPGNIATRIERIRSWHNASRNQAATLKLLAFFTGMEIKALHDDLGITPGNPALTGNSETVSELTNGRCRTWAELVEDQCGMTERTARNYVSLYEYLCMKAPAFVEAVLAVAAPRLDKIREPLALPDPQASIAKIPADAMDAFHAATDPWSLSEMYRRPMKPAHVQMQVELAKAASQKVEAQTYLKFWFDDLEAKIKNRSYLRLPRPQREMLVDTLELTLKDLKASLRTK
jgi:hypothetical protein